MTRKTRKLYDAVLQSMKEAYKEVAPEGRIRIKLVVTDYEQAMMGAFRKAFPEASVEGCWFHYGQVNRFSLCFNTFPFSNLYFILLS